MGCHVEGGDTGGGRARSGEEEEAAEKRRVGRDGSDGWINLGGPLEVLWTQVFLMLGVARNCS
jgi:hypothetical protein